jgi:D-3-phosphoglycerate dehydrogenase
MAVTNKYYVFDFDSTLTRVEALDVLAEIAFKDKPKDEVEKIVKEIAAITDLGIDGDISFTESLSRRIAILQANRNHLPELIEVLRQKISKSIQNNKEFFRDYSDQIYVISCGFKEFIDPIVAEYNIPSEKVYANTFEYDENGKIIGFDKNNPLSQHNGKIECLKGIGLEGEIQVIGDGYSDYVMREAGVAHKFFAYTENVAREKVLPIADYVAPSLDEFLYVNQLPMKISYPKNRIKVLLLEMIHPDAMKFLKEEGYNVELLDTSLTEDELCEAIKDVHVLGIRSKTNVTEKVIQHANKLLAVGAFCIGTKQIDLVACKKAGVAVFNAPYSNTRSVVELAIGEIIMLMRKTFVRSQELHNAVWKKTAAGSQEVRGKVLGIIGYGNIGAQLSVLAEAMGMKVIFYDVVEKLALGNAEKRASLEDVLKEADVVSLHVDDSPENVNLIGEKELSVMKPGSILINLARGFVVDIPALVNALKTKHISGAAVDVYPKEPKSNDEPFESELIGLENVILTPHIGGSTMEAQVDIADFVPKRIVEYINTGNSFDSVNLPAIRVAEQKKAHRFLHIHKNVSGVMAQVNRILADFDINVVGQYLKTDEEVGYLITDIDKEYDKEVIDALRDIKETIKFRLLY